MPPFRAVNLISDPIHGYIELTKRLAGAEAEQAGLEPETGAEDRKSTRLNSSH